ncbi:unnamed protein product [Adineta ricciae]|uniref:Cyclin-dependent kinase 2-associated protein n=1 Tax=Adineta ricciae TaxID=249248 RepID=A0A813QD35_ADIRI|nr:unnamed protein product [Adineta ricciae]
MDLSIRKPQQQTPVSSSQPILNPAAAPPISVPYTSAIPLPLAQTIQPSVSTPSVSQPRHAHPSKYAQLLSVIEEMGKDIKPTYAGNRNYAERLRRAIASARILVRECQLECDRNSRL